MARILLEMAMVVQTMKRIMAVLEASETNLWSAIHAINLAQRLGGKVFILRIFPSEENRESGTSQEERNGMLQQRLEALIEQARSQTVSVDYHIAFGSYEDELVRFIRETKIDILVLISPHLVAPGRRQRAISLENVRHRVNCRIELVYEKPD
jgi:nucleotide-binding universal stress UspA family protein